MFLLDVAQRWLYSAWTTAIVSVGRNVNEPSTVAAIPDVRRRATRDRLIEPHTFDEGRMLDEAKQGRLGGYEPPTRFFFGQAVDRVMQCHPILVDELVHPLTLFIDPLTALFHISTLRTSGPPCVWRDACHRTDEATTSAECPPAPKTVASSTNVC